MTDFHLLREKLSALPVYKIIDPVMQDVTKGSVTVVAASTSSGKSMILPGALADISDHQIVVLAPRRFLALDAAYNVADLSQLKIGDEVGYAIGQLNGESSQRSDKTKLLYCTYGYAISSGLINKARTIVLDEVHEADEQISLARAILRERKAKDPDLRVLEMSATIDAEHQARYWDGVAKTSVHKIEGKALDCDALHEAPSSSAKKERSAEDIVTDLISKGRKGIVLFRPGVREVETAVTTLKAKLLEAHIVDTDVVGIHGGTPSDERRSARRAPQAGRRKVIVGTNVIESGVNLRWLDAGVSDGFRKIPYHRDDTGAEALVLESLPQSGLLQQMGRVNRDPKATGFERGLFILHAKQPFEMRRPQNAPAIQRQSLNSIAFYAASLGYDPTKLTWDISNPAAATQLKTRLEQAKEELIQLQLIKDDWSLTRDGLFIKHLPVSPESGALLSEARRLDEQKLRKSGDNARVMRDAVVLAALMEGHGLRKDSKLGHKGDQYRTSDLLDGMNAFRIIMKEPLAAKVLAVTETELAALSDAEMVAIQKDRADLQVLCLKHNVALNGFIETARLADEIGSRLGERDKGIRLDSRKNDDKYDATRYGELQQCILSANVNRVFSFENGGLRDLLRDFGKNRADDGGSFNAYEVGNASIVVPGSRDGQIYVGGLREVKVDTDVGSSPLLLRVLSEVTAVPAEFFIAWAVSRNAVHQPVLTDVETSGSVLAATYAGKASFEMKVPQHMNSATASLVTDGGPTRENAGRKGKHARNVP